MRRSRKDEPGPHCVAHRVRMLSRAVTALYGRASGAAALKPSQLNVLVAVRSFPDSTAAELARRMRMDKSTSSRHLAWLAGRGLVATRSRADGKRVVSLTAAGRRTIDRVRSAWAEAQREAVRRLGKDGWAALELVLERLAPSEESELRSDGRRGFRAGG